MYIYSASLILHFKSLRNYINLKRVQIKGMHKTNAGNGIKCYRVHKTNTTKAAGG